MKQCTACGKLKDESEFNKKSSNKDGLERYCKECHRDKNRTHYNKNKQAYITSANKWQEDKRRWWTEYKSTLKCSVCGEDRWWCLDFHHTDPHIKENSVSQMVVNNIARERIMKEVSKCVVVCRNCHADMHYKERISR